MDTNGRDKMHLTGKRPRRRPSAGSHPGKEPEVQVQYTPAKPFNRNRFLLRLATVAAVVLALVVGMSIFFKVGQVTVSGAEKYTEWDIQQASGIRAGDGLLGLSKAQISARICQKLPYVETVRVGIKLPDTVHIEITERTVAYAVEDTASAWWLLNAQGRIIDSTNADAAKNYTRILGVKLQNAAVGEQAVAAEPVAETTGDTPVLPAASAKSQLDAAVQLIAALEKNGVMGTVDTVDAANPEGLSLLYEARFQVSLGDTSRLDYKISAMKAAIVKMGQYESGYLDVSFTTYPNEVQHRPFE
ncbi:MAG: FtsQ-type POTRA domain-containing protein [Oscillospiraceae bacterium]|nr:FtsQ-type POTRA domain-containing protein [Oscillospiraceae bacterium]